MFNLSDGALSHPLALAEMRTAVRGSWSLQTGQKKDRMKRWRLVCGLGTNAGRNTKTMMAPRIVWLLYTGKRTGEYVYAPE